MTWRKVPVGSHAHVKASGLNIGDQFGDVFIYERIGVLAGEINPLDACTFALGQELIEVFPFVEVRFDLVVLLELFVDVLAETEVTIDIARAQHIDVGEHGCFTRQVLFKLGMCQLVAPCFGVGGHVLIFQRSCRKTADL